MPFRNEHTKSRRLCTTVHKRTVCKCEYLSKTVKERKVSPVTSLYPALYGQIYKHHLLHCERNPRKKINNIKFL